METNGQNKTPITATVSYVELFKRCPKEQVHHLNRLHAKHKEYVRRLQKLPAVLPPIDWEDYKKNVLPRAVKIVEDFEKQYKTFKVPYPQDKYSCELQGLKEQVKAEVKSFIDESNKRIQCYQDEIKRIQNMTPYNEMTMEQFYEEVPEMAIDFINKPTFWPHTPEEQMTREQYVKFMEQELAKGIEEKKRREDGKSKDMK